MAGWPSGLGCALDMHVKSAIIGQDSAWVRIPLLPNFSDVIKFDCYLIGLALPVYGCELEVCCPLKNRPNTLSLIYM